MEEPLITKDQINQPANKVKAKMKSLTGILIALLAAVIAGAGVWAYYTYKVIPDLEKQPISTVYSKSTPPTKTTTPAPSTVDETSDWKIYTNSTYGFSLKFNDLWRNYQVIPKKPSPNDATGLIVRLYVCIPTASKTWSSDIQSGLFCPLAINIVQADKKNQFEQESTSMIPTYINENPKYVFYYSTAEDSPNDGVNVMSDVKNIISTFQFTK